MLTGEKDGFLEELQELGVVDITRSTKPIDEESHAMLEKAQRAKNAVEVLEKIDYSKDSKANEIAKLAKKQKIGEDIVQFVETQINTLNELKTSLSIVEKEIVIREPWGDYDKSALDSLLDKGYKMHYYGVDKKAFNPDWAKLYPLQIVKEDNKKLWFVTIVEKEASYDFPISECARPEGTLAEAKAKKAQIETDILGCQASLLRAKKDIEKVKALCNDDLVELDKYLADAASESVAENHISVITGFAPEELDSKLCAKFDEMGVFYLKAKAVEADDPPIKLKNNWFVRQFEVFTKMYGMPVYSEFDPTIIVAPFYLLFFSMCLGDAGYGIILLIFGILLNKGIVKVGMFEGLGNIIALLGAGTMVVGTLMGGFFGISLYEASWVPAWLKSIMVVGEVEIPGFGVFNIQMLVAIGIGIFHICLAMIIKAICYTQRFGFKANISTWGWVILIVGGLITILLGSAKLLSPESMKWVIIVIGAISALAIFILNTPGRNPLINIGAGLWDTYGMATGIFGDVLSYIRLFALGLAGGMLGTAFNDLAGMVLGDSFMTWIPFILIVIVGHILNILLSSLGAFVHPLRLTFVEYFKNVGYEGLGKAYNPLKK